MGPADETRNGNAYPGFGHGGVLVYIDRIEHLGLHLSGYLWEMSSKDIDTRP